MLTSLSVKLENFKKTLIPSTSYKTLVLVPGYTLQVYGVGDGNLGHKFSIITTFFSISKPFVTHRNIEGQVKVARLANVTIINVNFGGHANVTKRGTQTTQCIASKVNLL